MAFQNQNGSVTELEMVRSELKKLKKENEDRIRCEKITNIAMKEALNQNHPEDEIQCFLASIGRNLEVDRIYIFEDNLEDDVTDNTYEWCDENIEPQIDFLQQVPREAAAWWYEQFEIGEAIHIPDLEAIRESAPLTYSYLEPQGIHSLIAHRLVHGEKIIGFFGVDNPKVELMEDISFFLNTCSDFLMALIQNRNIYRSREAQYVEELENKNKALNRALHEAKEAGKAKSQFFSSMSHDIRTPLNAIIGMTSIAKEHIDDKSRVGDCLHKITVSSRHLLGLINDVLDMAKIESGKMNLTMEEISLEEILDSVSTITRMQAGEKNQHYSIETRDILSDRVICDGLRLNQILLNLLSNAIKFTPGGGSIKVNLWQEASAKDPDSVITHLTVSDTGIGMSPDFMETIFEAFTREDVKRIQKTQGTGLGMAITKRIVDAMGGSITVESEVNRGTTFFVTLEMKKGKAPDRKAEHSSGEEISLNGMNILLAEDNDINAEIAITILEGNGASVTHGEDGLKAFRLFDQSEPGTYDVILMDLRMPNMDGLEATRSIRALERPDAKKIPIIAMTADAFSEDVQKCLDAGMSAHVSKPIDVDILKNTIVRLIRG